MNKQKIKNSVEIECFTKNGFFNNKNSKGKRFASFKRKERLNFKRKEEVKCLD